VDKIALDKPARKLLRQWDTATAVASIVFASLGTVSAEAPTEQLLLDYDFAESSGTTVRDLSGNNYSGTLVGGEDWHAGYLQLNGANYVDLPDGLLAEQTVATVVVETSPERLSGAQFLWNFGGSGNSAIGQFFIQPVDPRVTISKRNYSTEQTAKPTQKLAANHWQSIAATISKNADGRHRRCASTSTASYGQSASTPRGRSHLDA